MVEHRDPDGERSRYPNTAERYAALKPETREFIESLRVPDLKKLNSVIDMSVEDIENMKAFREMLRVTPLEKIKESLELADTFRTANKFFKWGVGVIAAAFTITAAAVTLGSKVYGYLKPSSGGHP